MITLHDNINTYLNQISNIERTNAVVSSILGVVIDNFNKIREVAYKYILYYFNNMTYEYNLYTFNYLIEAVKMNIELLGKATEAREIESK